MQNWTFVFQTNSRDLCRDIRRFMYSYISGVDLFHRCILHNKLNNGIIIHVFYCSSYIKKFRFVGIKFTSGHAWINTRAECVSTNMQYKQTVVGSQIYVTVFNIYPVWIWCFLWQSKRTMLRNYSFQSCLKFAKRWYLNLQAIGPKFKIVASSNIT